MFALPSLWNLFASTLVFFIVAWYIHRYLDQQALPKNMNRSILVFVIASVVSWGAGEAADWAQEKMEGPQPTAQNSPDLSQLLKAAGLAQP